MFIHYYFKNKLYRKSQRNFLSDYSFIKSKKIDMTLSGRYLADYSKINLNLKMIDKYPSHEEIEEFENIIKKDLRLNKEIIIGSGANGLLQNIIKILFIKKGNLVTPFYTFDQAEFAVTSFNGYTKRVYCDDYMINLNKIRKAIDNKTRMIYICNPNNPTGIYLDADEIINFTKSTKIPVVIDESGIEFTNKKSILEMKELPNNLIVLRSFSKAYGIANLRIGFLICSNYIKNKYLKNITTNEFSGISCSIAKDLYKNNNISKNVSAITNERKKIEKELKKLKIDLIKSDSNIIMTKTTFDNSFIEMLKENDISVVPVYDEYNKLHIRIAIQDKKTNEIFINKMKEIIKDKY